MTTLLVSNIYRDLVHIITSNNFKIIKEKTYDPQSGWTGCYYKVFDGDNFVTDLSSNGYCFTNSTIEKCYEEINKYLQLKNLDNIDAFRVWCDEYAGDP